jgi:L-rhamnose-H+ transport protein
MLLFDTNEFLTLHGGVILAGVVVCLLGVVVCGRAGILKERSQKSDDDTTKPDESAYSTAKKPKILIGLLLAFVSGVLCACYAVAYSCGEHIGTVAGAEEGANNPAWAVAWAITAMILWGGAVSSCLYCALQLTRNRTWSHLAKPGIVLVLALAAAMAVLHNAAIFFFGLGAINLGGLGVSAGYPVFMSLAIIVGNVHGFRTGEWRGASRRSIVWIIVGIAVLIAGVCIIAQGKAMM